MNFKNFNRNVLDEQGLNYMSFQLKKQNKFLWLCTSQLMKH